MIVFRAACTLILLLFSFSVHSEVIHKKYFGYDSWIDCSKRSTVLVKYEVRADHSNLSMDKNFHFDESIPERCRQTSTGTYRTPYSKTYHRGHQATFNHLDYNLKALDESNFITSNILPQTAALNTGAMTVTENYIECQRDKYKGTAMESDYRILVFMGPLYEPDSGLMNNYFLKSHGIMTPSSFFKIAIAGTSYNIDEVKAWIMPNSDEATKEMADQYLTTVEEVELRSGYQINLPESLKNQVAKTSISEVKKCDWK